MKKMMRYFLILNVLIFSLSACSSNDDPDDNLDPCNSGFDQKAMLENITDNLILPLYNQFQNDVNELAEANQVFQNTLDDSSLASLQDKFKSAYLSFQYISQFEFGPAEEVFLRNSLNNFPVNTEDINENISTGVYNFDMPDEFDKGFPALDYMLFGVGENATNILSVYNGSEGENYLDYLSAIIIDIKERTDHTIDKWNLTYATEFINNTGSSAGSSVSLLVNQFNQNFEIIKRDRIGIPAGIFTLDIAQPEFVEARFSLLSKELAINSLDAAMLLFKGQSSNGNDGLGFDDYLLTIGVEKNEVALSSLIETSFTEMKNSISTTQGSLQDVVENDRAKLIEIYNKSATQLVNIKTDMPTALCVSITYIDNPSDSD